MVHKCKTVTHHFQNLVAGFLKEKWGKDGEKNPPRLYTTGFPVDCTCVYNGIHL